MAIVLPPANPLFSNALAGLAAPAPIGRSQAITPVLPGSLPASTSVFFSDVAQRLLTQLAEDPTLDIDTAFAEIALDLTQDSALASPLFSRSGLLQPTLGAPLLSQNLGTGATDTTGLPQEALLTGEQSLFAGPRNTASPATALATEDRPLAALTAPANPADAEADTSIAASTANIAAPATSPAATSARPADTPTTAAAQRVAAVNEATATVDTALIAAQTFAAASDLDPYQQAALIAGLTSFGKEQNNSLTAPPNTDDTVIEGIAAIRAVEERRYDSTDAWLGARR